MTNLETELEKLKDRMRKAQEYYKTKYESDTTKNKAKADETIKQLQTRIDEVFQQMSKTVDIRSDMSSEESVKVIEKFKDEFLYPVRVDYYSKNGNIKILLMPPEFIKWAETKVIDA
jgi:ABC-type phosphate transport system auxiliary subunit